MKYIRKETLIKNNIEYYNIINLHNKNFGEISWSQKLYNFNYNIIEQPKCLECNKFVKFHRYSTGYRKFCSNNCGLKSKITKDKRDKTKQRKYGDVNYNNREKFKKTCLDKFGETSPMKNIDVMNKSIKTNIFRYNNKTPLLNKYVKDKIKKTKILKYGDVNYNNREKFKKTCLDKFGETSPIKNINVMNKLIKTNLIKYGVENVFQSKLIIKKIKEINNKRFKNKWAKILNISINNILINGNMITINDLCDKHESFTITKSLLYDRFRFGIQYCTKCNVIGTHYSDAENKIRNFIENELNIKTQKIRINNKEIDIYLSEKKIGIEFNGLYWHSELFKDKNYHLDKTELCEQNGVQLLHIFEDEWIYKKEIVKSIIKSKLGLIDNKIYGRKTEIKEIDSKQSKNFLNKNHIQGNVNSKIRIGLFYKNKLVSVMTFEKTRKSIKIDNEISFTLNRFCNELNSTVIGGASKLLKYFVKIYNPKSIISFADRRYSQGNLYEQLGFSKIKINQPSYSYFKNNELIRYHRFNFRKEILKKRGYDINKTERIIMKENNYFKIFDCGNIKYLLKF